MAQIFLNNCYATLAQAITATDTQIELSGMNGFPASLGAGDFFLLTLYADTTRYGENIEVVKVTGVGATSVTVERGFEGTAAGHALGERAEARLTAQSLTYSKDRANHTGTQDVSTIDGLQEALSGVIDDTVIAEDSAWSSNKVDAELSSVVAAIPEAVSDYQEFTSSGTWVKPEGCNVVYVEVIGAGAGAGEESGGGGGAYASRVFSSSSLPSSVYVTVGSGGSGGSGYRTTYGGGNSVFDSLIGKGGYSGTSSNRLVGNAGGGQRGHLADAEGGYESGAGGYRDYRDGRESMMGGAGGGSAINSGHTRGGMSVNGGDGGDASVTGTGRDGQFPGGGGGATYSGSRGGNGGDGVVRVWAW